jgi:hypothetical protein
LNLGLFGISGFLPTCFVEPIFVAFPRNTALKNVIVSIFGFLPSEIWRLFGFCVFA